MSNTVQILANIGVIASIVFLSIQVRQNNELLGVQLRGDSLERIVGSADMLLENPHLLALLHEDADALSPRDRDTLIVLGIRNLSNFETAFEEASRGLQDEAGLARRIKAVWNRPQLNYGMPLAWPTFRERASPDFVAWMERNVVNVEN